MRPGGNVVKVAAITLMVCSTVFGTGCALFFSAPVIPGSAFVYANTRAPMDVDFERTEVGPKRGRASVTTILALVSFGDASAASAANDGGISTIRHADYEYYNILGIYQRFTTVVYGE
jgi:hypothetical protein